MSTLCTQATNSTSTNNHFRDIGVVSRQTCIHRPDAHAGLASRLFNAITRFVSTRYNQYIDRQAFGHVHKLDDRMLKDIGVSRQDVKWASSLPLSEDAAARLEVIARRRK